MQCDFAILSGLYIFGMPHGHRIWFFAVLTVTIHRIRLISGPRRLNPTGWNPSCNSPFAVAVI